MNTNKTRQVDKRQKSNQSIPKLSLGPALTLLKEKTITFLPVTVKKEDFGEITFCLDKELMMGKKISECHIYDLKHDINNNRDNKPGLLSWIFSVDKLCGQNGHLNKQKYLHFIFNIVKFT